MRNVSKKSPIEQWLHTIGFAIWLISTCVLAITHSSGVPVFEWCISGVFAIPIAVVCVYVLSFLGYALREKSFSEEVEKNKRWALIFVIAYVSVAVLGFLWGYSYGGESDFGGGVFGAIVLPIAVLAALGFLSALGYLIWMFISWLLHPRL